MRSEPYLAGTAVDLGNDAEFGTKIMLLNLHKISIMGIFVMFVNTATDEFYQTITHKLNIVIIVIANIILEMIWYFNLVTSHIHP